MIKKLISLIITIAFALQVTGASSSLRTTNYKLRTINALRPTASANTSQETRYQATNSERPGRIDLAELGIEKGSIEIYSDKAERRRLIRGISIRIAAYLLASFIVFLCIQYNFYPWIAFFSGAAAILFDSVLSTVPDIEQLYLDMQTRKIGRIAHATRLEAEDAKVDAILNVLYNHPDRRFTANELQAAAKGEPFHANVSPERVAQLLTLLCKSGLVTRIDEPARIFEAPAEKRTGPTSATVVEGRKPASAGSLLSEIIKRVAEEKETYARNENFARHLASLGNIELSNILDALIYYDRKLDKNLLPEQEILYLLSEALSVSLSGIQKNSFISYLKEAVLKPSSDMPPKARILIQSYLSVADIDRPINVTTVYAMYHEQERMQSPSEAEGGEDALRLKVQQQENLYRVNPLVNHRMIAVNDGDDRDAKHGLRSSDVARAILAKDFPQYCHAEEGAIAKIQVLDMAQRIREAIGSMKGGAIIYGIRKALNDGADYVVYTDQDTSVSLAEEGVLLRPLVIGKADVSLGLRHSHPAATKRPLLRRLKHHGFLFLAKFNIPYLSEFIDMQAGFKAISRGVLDKTIPLNEEWEFDPRFEYGGSFDLNLLARMKKSKARFAQVPVCYFESEQSRFSGILPVYRMAGGILRVRDYLRQWDGRTPAGMETLEKAAGILNEYLDGTGLNWYTNCPTPYFVTLDDARVDPYFRKIAELEGGLSILGGSDLVQLMLGLTKHHVNLVFVETNAVRRKKNEQIKIYHQVAIPAWGTRNRSMIVPELSVNSEASYDLRSYILNAKEGRYLIYGRPAINVPLKHTAFAIVPADTSKKVVLIFRTREDFRNYSSKILTLPDVQRQPPGWHKDVSQGALSNTIRYSAIVYARAKKYGWRFSEDSLRALRTLSARLTQTQRLNLRLGVRASIEEDFISKDRELDKTLDIVLKELGVADDQAVSKPSSAGENLAELIYPIFVKIYDKSRGLVGAGAFKLPEKAYLRKLLEAILDIMPAEAISSITDALIDEANYNLRDRMEYAITFYDFLDSAHRYREDAEYLLGLFSSQSYISVFDINWMRTINSYLESLTMMIISREKIERFLNILGQGVELNPSSILLEHGLRRVDSCLRVFYFLTEDKFNALMIRLEKVDPDNTGILGTLFALNPELFAELFQPWADEDVQRGPFVQVPEGQERVSHLIEYRIAGLPGLASPQEAAYWQLAYNKTGYMPKAPGQEALFVVHGYDRKGKYASNYSKFETLYNRLILGEKEETLAERMLRVAEEDLPVSVTRPNLSRLLSTRKEDVVLALLHASRFDRDRFKYILRILTQLIGIQRSRVTTVLQELEELIKPERGDIPAKNIAELNCALGSARGVEADFKEALEAFPLSAYYYYRYGVFLGKEATRRDEAKKALEMAVDIKPDFLQARIALGDVYVAALTYEQNNQQPQNYEKALLHLRYALQLVNRGSHQAQVIRSKIAEAHAMMSPKIFTDAQVYKERAAFLKAAADECPRNRLILFRLAELYHDHITDLTEEERANYIVTVERLMKTPGSDMADALFYLDLAIYYSDAGDAEKSQRLWQEIYEHKNDFLSLCSSGEQLQRALAIQPLSAEANLMLGMLLTKSLGPASRDFQQVYQKAISMLETAVAALDSDDEKSNLARSAIGDAKLKKYNCQLDSPTSLLVDSGEQERFIIDAIGSSPHHAGLIFALFDIYSLAFESQGLTDEQRKRFMQGLRTLVSIKTRWSFNKLSRFQELAECYEAVKDFKGAIAVLRLLLTIKKKPYGTHYTDRSIGREIERLGALAVQPATGLVFPMGAQGPSIAIDSAA